MSRYSKDKIQEIDAQIGRLMAIYPNISALKISETLGFDHNFVCKRKKKIEQKNTEAIKTLTVEQDLGDIRNFLNSTLPEIAKIIFNKDSADKDKIGAMKVIMEGKKTFLDHKFDAGIFERQLGKLKTDTSFGEEEKKLIAEALNYAFNTDKPTKDTGGV